MDIASSFVAPAAGVLVLLDRGHHERDQVGPVAEAAERIRHDIAHGPPVLGATRQLLLPEPHSEQAGGLLRRSR